MNVSSLITSGVLAGLLVVAGADPGSSQGRGGSPAPGAAPETKAPPTVATVPVYKPPLRGAPGGRVGGGTRGSSRDKFVLAVLAPDHNGLTVSEQPALYWFISSATALPVEVAIADPNRTEPLLETRTTLPVGPGVHRVSLAEHGVRLAPGVAYRWSVTVIPDPDRRSRDILASGSIERIEPPAGLRTKVATAKREELPFIYAEAGVWYDALAAVSELILRTPNEAALRQQRAGLLAQVGLPEVAEAEARTPR